MSGLAEDDNVARAKDVLSGLNAILFAEFFAILKSALDENDKRKLATNYANFLNGFARGAMQAADTIYDEVFSLAFGIGYTIGFRDGYALGYAHGYQDGYAQGYNDAWKAARTVIESLEKQISDLQTQLADSSGGGFWDTVGQISQVVDTAIGAIGLAVAAG